MLNKKGFTMVELLMAICILAVIMAIAVPTVTSYYETSKVSTEKIFIDKLTRIVDDYISFNANDFNLSPALSNKITKCRIATEDIEFCMEEDNYQVDVYKVVDTVSFADIINQGLIADTDFINPRNNLKCSPEGSIIEIYQDKDRVNYYRYILQGCDISDENFIKKEKVFDRKEGLVYDNYSVAVNPALAEIE